MNTEQELKRGLFRIFNELETPSYVWEDTANSLTYVCYCLKKGSIETDVEFKIKLIDESTGDIIIKETTRKLPICIGVINTANIRATLTGYEAAGEFKYV